MVDAPSIRQRLFSAQEDDGTTLFLAFLSDGGCAILRDEQVIETWENEAQALSLALDRFMELTHTAQNQRHAPAAPN